MSSKYVNMSNEPSLMGVLKVLKENIFETMNCVKIGYIDSYDYDTRVSRVIIYNKRVIGLNNNGEHILEDYPPLYCKTLFIGGANTGINWSIEQGDECIVFFNDTEIETPWISGQVSDIKYGRQHNYTDALCITGFSTLPNTKPTNENLNLYCKNGIIYLDGNTRVDGNIVVNGNVVINGTLTVSADAIIGGISFLEHIHIAPDGATTPPVS